jgi:hypothetical protein
MSSVFDREALTAAELRICDEALAFCRDHPGRWFYPVEIFTDVRDSKALSRLIVSGVFETELTEGWNNGTDRRLRFKGPPAGRLAAVKSAAKSDQPDLFAWVEQGSAGAFTR